MGYVLVDANGKHNAIVGDKVVTGGGVYEKMADGTSKLVEKLSTPSGTTKSYADVVNEFNRLASGGSKNSSSTTNTTVVTPYAPPPTTQVYDSPTNYDNYTLPLEYDYSSASSQAAVSNTGSKIVGYAVVALVLLVVADKIMGK